jgi:hypothetical protein
VHASLCWSEFRAGMLLFYEWDYVLAHSSQPWSSPSISTHCLKILAFSYLSKLLLAHAWLRLFFIKICSRGNNVFTSRINMSLRKAFNQRLNTCLSENTIFVLLHLYILWHRISVEANSETFLILHICVVSWRLGAGCTNIRLRALVILENCCWRMHDCVSDNNHL